MRYSPTLTGQSSGTVHPYEGFPRTAVVRTLSLLKSGTSSRVGVSTIIRSGVVTADDRYVLGEYRECYAPFQYAGQAHLVEPIQKELITLDELGRKMLGLGQCMISLSELLDEAELRNGSQVHRKILECKEIIDFRRSLNRIRYFGDTGNTKFTYQQLARFDRDRISFHNRYYEGDFQH